ncbi:MAG: hypothetical protein LBD88_00730 [Candidatus Peribacteria bacterium]|nr:hypothetical protein [Candidatus Peribacteria bacterium]
MKKERKNSESKWETKPYNPIEKLINLFKEYEIDKNYNIVQQILNKNSKDLYEKLFQIINIILSIRNSETERESLEKKREDKDYIAKDFIHCPVCKYHSEKKLNISKN